MNWREAHEGLVAAHRAGRALKFAIELWRSTPHEELRSLAQSFEKEVQVAPLKASGEEKFQEWTRAFVESTRPVPRDRFDQLGALIATATPKVAKLALGFVAQQEPDPRFAGMLSTVARANRALLDSPLGLNTFCRALLQHADTGHRHLLRELSTAAAMNLHKPLSAKRKFLDEVPSPPPGWCSEAQSSSAPQSTPSQTDEAALWSQVYERPEDLSARAVLSDHLIERGDPRGAFIAAQLAGDTTQPPKELVGSFLGPIAGAVRVESVRFARGFPVSGNVNGSLAKGKLAVAMLHREWATFEALEHLERLAPTLRSLTSAPALERHGVDEWLKKGWQFPLRHVGIPFSSVDRAARLPTRLEHLSLQHPYVDADMDLGPLFDSLRTIATLRTLSFGSAMLRIEKPTAYFTSDLGDAWPIWTEQARQVPALETITWALPDGSLELVSEQKRFDTLRIVPRHSHLPGQDRQGLVAQALKLSGATRRVRVSEGQHAQALEAALSRAGFQLQDIGER